MTARAGAAGRRLRGDAGTAVVELVWLGILLLVPMTWIVVSVFQVQQGAFAVSGAARAAGRAYALAPSDADGRARALAAARQVLRDHDAGELPLTLAITCSPYPRDCHSGSSVVTVRLGSRVALPMLPDILGGGAPSFALRAAHVVPVGQYQEVVGAGP